MSSGSDPNTRLVDHGGHLVDEVVHGLGLGFTAHLAGHFDKLI